MILSDLISIPQHRDGEYPEAWLLMGASISHCGKPASLLTPAQLCPGWSISPHGHWFTDRRRTTLPGTRSSQPGTYVTGNYGENIWEWNKRRACLFRYFNSWSCIWKSGPTFAAASSPSLPVISLHGFNQPPLISVFIIRLIPRSLIVIQGRIFYLRGCQILTLNPLSFPTCAMNILKA